MPDDPVEILGGTSDAFVAAAAARGVARPEALARYRAVFRDGRSPDGPGWISTAEMPVVEVEEEGVTRKFRQRLASGLRTESVILPQRSRTGRLRTTLCVSSQVGCARGCTFCETGRMGLLANLAPAEIVGQWHAARFDLGATIGNVVFMGMGEPMDNLDGVLPAIEVLADPNGPAVPAARISVSTVGRIDGIERLAAFARRPGFRKLRLAVSLNASNDDVRDRIMPINRTAPMADLMAAMRGWPATEQRPLLIEYVLIPGVNDTPAHADELCAYLAPLPSTVNVIPYNPMRDSPWPAPDDASVERFVARVRSHGRRVTRRRTMGRSLMGACGQLGDPSIRRERTRISGPSGKVTPRSVRCDGTG
jgi:23S rRNA (adenine2503-C2)-methyltransferase